MNGDEAIDFTIWQVALAYVFILIVFLIVKIKKIPRKRLIIVSAVRMTLQLIIVGYILMYVLDHPSPWITVPIMILMLLFVTFTVFHGIKQVIYFFFKKLIVLQCLLVLL